VAPDVTRLAARGAYEALRAEAARRELAAMPLDRIREVTKGQLRLQPLEKAGYQTVGAVLSAPPQVLDAIPGVGPQTITQVRAAARQLQLALAETARVRFDPDARTPPQAALLGALHSYEAAKSLVPPQGPDLAPLAADLDQHLSEAVHTGSKVRMFFKGAHGKQDARDALGKLAAIIGSRFAVDAGQRIAAAERELGRPTLGSPAPQSPPPAPPRGPVRSWNIAQGVQSAPQASPAAAPAWRRAVSPADAARLWEDYLARPVVYNGLLAEVAGTEPDREASQGYLPAEIAERVHQFPLDLSMVTTSLRGYQAFGAKFALVQERVIIGDEMGLGKTIEALAAMCHLAANGTRHFLVVCPASVVVNWTREVRQHTRLGAYRLHGSEHERERNARAWASNGGVAVTTYEMLRETTPMPQSTLGMLVVDEAHYAKNPAALRTKAVRRWAGACQRVLFLTGTPMENRVDEFRELITPLRPEVARSVRDVDGALGSTRFRGSVAPVYLRRNQDDVLTELPDRLETQDWVELRGPALSAYREAVFAGNFMAMRRAAFAPGTVEDSAKLERLADIVHEATADGRKVVVFSYFRDVLETVVRVLGPDLALGPITGDVPPPARQAMVDQFTERPGPAVLVSQIQAGGVGLNIQAASVVIITEPQMTPSAEEQAIARAHRMGQVRRVDVHRLLAEDSVDQQMLELLHGKRLAFDEYARRSDLALASPDAMDVSDLASVYAVAGEAGAEPSTVAAGPALGAAQPVVSEGEAQRRIIEFERERLRAQPTG
jgi:superfamily II DNA or RNA helicase